MCLSAIKGKIGKDEAEEMFRTTVLPIIERNADVFAMSDERLDPRELVASAHRMASIIMAYAFDRESGDKARNADDDGYETDEEEASQQKVMMPMVSRES